MSRDSYGPYVVRGPIGERGGNADVYEAEHKQTGELAAVKTPRARKPDSEPYLRFRDEVEFHRKYRDPGILPMLDGFAPAALAKGELAWMAMPLATPFTSALANQDLTTVVEAVVSVAETLARLHAREIHHRDLKPSNLFVSGGSHVIGDFGLVTFPQKQEITAGDRHLGPIYYIAPEMITAPETAAPGPADVYSLAKTLWVLATGSPRPSPGPLNVPQVALRAILVDERAVLLDPLLDVCTRYDPGERPTMAALAIELRQWLAPPVASVSPNQDQIAASSKRLEALLAPGRRQEESRMEQMRAANLAAERLKGVLEPVKRTIDFATKIPDSYNTFTEPFNRFPQLSADNPTYVNGWASIHNSQAPVISLIAWVGVQLRADGMLRLAGAFAIEPYSGSGRELIWSETRDVIPGGAHEAGAISAIQRGLVEAIPKALSTFADRIQGV